jgi:signal peptidase I
MRHWKPTAWIAAVLGLFLTPLAMLYVQRPRLALVYFLAACLSGLLTFFSMWAFGSREVSFLFSLAGWAISIGCAVHAFRIAKSTQAGDERKWYSRSYVLASIPLSIFLVVFLARSFMYEPFRIPSQSMHPTIPQGSVVFVDKAGFGHYGTYGIRLWHGNATATIARGDIVVHEVAVDPPMNYISRIVGHGRESSHGEAAEVRPSPEFPAVRCCRTRAVEVPHPTTRSRASARGSSRRRS